MDHAEIAQCRIITVGKDWIDRGEKPSDLLDFLGHGGAPVDDAFIKLRAIIFPYRYRIDQLGSSKEIHTPEGEYRELIFDLCFWKLRVWCALGKYDMFLSINSSDRIKTNDIYLSEAEYRRYLLDESIVRLDDWGTSDILNLEKNYFWSDSNV